MHYYLAEACQNRFLLFDYRHLDRLNNTLIEEAHRELVKLDRDDALILLKENLMIVLGQDGKLGEFCANGARACAAFLYKTQTNGNFFLESSMGKHPLKQYGTDLYSVTLPRPKFTWNDRFIAKHGLDSGLHYVEAVEPHLVVQSEMSGDELVNLGKTLNRRRDWFPHGINVNAWKRLDENKIAVQTYERGVQRLTLSCGTGSICCAAFYKGEGEVEVATRGGDLKIHFQEETVELLGEASYDLKSRRIS